MLSRRRPADVLMALFARTSGGSSLYAVVGPTHFRLRQRVRLLLFGRSRLPRRCSVENEKASRKIDAAAWLKTPGSSDWQ